MNVTKITAWAGAILAVLAVSTAGLTGAKWLIAQEAAKQMAPVQQAVEQLVEQGRQREDREKLWRCLDKEHQELEPEDRKAVCTEESAERWKEWKLEDDKKKKPE